MMMSLTRFFREQRLLFCCAFLIAAGVALVMPGPVNAA